MTWSDITDDTLPDGRDKLNAEIPRLGSEIERLDGLIVSGESISADRGNTNVTLTAESETVQFFATTLTAERFVTLPADPPTATRFVVIRDAAGTFPLTVRDAGLAAVHSLPAADSWAEVWWNGSTWIVRHSAHESLDTEYVLRAGDVDVGPIRVEQTIPGSEDELVTKSYADSVVGSTYVHAFAETTGAWWFLGNLLAANQYTPEKWDKFFMMVRGGHAWGAGRMTQEMIVYNPSPTNVQGWIQTRGTDAGAAGDWGIRGYRQANGSINFYAFVAANKWIALTLDGQLQKGDVNGLTVARIVQSAPTSTTPLGTLVFDSRTFVTS